MHKLIICEGRDGIGKTSLSESLALHYNAKLITSPSKTNNAAFLRDVTKTDMSLEPFERQCLHTVCNVVDFYETLVPHNGNVVADRFLISALAYGLADGADAQKLDILLEVHHRLFNALGLGEKFEVCFVYLDREKRFGEKDGSYHEQAIDSDRLRKAYEFLFSDEQQKEGPFLCDGETVVTIRVGDKTREEVLAEAIEKVGT